MYVFVDTLSPVRRAGNAYRNQANRHWPRTFSNSPISMVVNPDASTRSRSRAGNQVFEWIDDTNVKRMIYAIVARCRFLTAGTPPLRACTFSDLNLDRCGPARPASGFRPTL